MAKIMVTGKYPAHKFKDMMKNYMSPDKPKYSDSVKKLENWVPQVTGEIKAYAVYECPDDKIIEALTSITKRYHFYSQVEGYRYRIELLSDMEDAIKSIMSK